MSMNPVHGEMYSIHHYVIKFVVFSQGTLVSSTNKTDCHVMTEILLKVVLNTIKPKPNLSIVRRNMDVNEHERLSNFMQIKVNEQCFDCCFTSHCRVFNNEHSLYSNNEHSLCSKKECETAPIGS